MISPRISAPRASRAFEVFQRENRRAFAEHQAGALAVERPAFLRRRGLERIEADEDQLGDARRSRRSGRAGSGPSGCIRRRGRWRSCRRRRHSRSPDRARKCRGLLRVDDRLFAAGSWRSSEGDCRSVRGRAEGSGNNLRRNVMPPLVVPTTVSSGLNPGSASSASSSAPIIMCEARCRRSAATASLPWRAQLLVRNLAGGLAAALLDREPRPRA